METNENINDLLGRPLWQLSCQEYLALMRYFTSEREDIQPMPYTVPRQAIGVPHLARELGCSASLIYSIKKSGVLEESVISRIGRKEVFAVEAARRLANDYMARMRENRNRQKK